MQTSHPTSNSNVSPEMKDVVAHARCDCFPAHIAHVYVCYRVTSRFGRRDGKVDAVAFLDVS